jgi:hypothetical protein
MEAYVACTMAENDAVVLLDIREIVVNSFDAQQVTVRMVVPVMRRVKAPNVLVLVNSMTVDVVKRRYVQTIIVEMVVSAMWTVMDHYDVDVPKNMVVRDVKRGLVTTVIAITEVVVDWMPTDCLYVNVSVLIREFDVREICVMDIVLMVANVLWMEVEPDVIAEELDILDSSVEIRKDVNPTIVSTMENVPW